MGNTGVVPTTGIVFVHLTIRRMPGGASRMSPLLVCLVWSNIEADGGAKLLCLSIHRNTKVRQTFMGGPMEPRLDVGL